MVILNFNEKFYTCSGKRLATRPENAVVIYLDNRSGEPKKGTHPLRDLLQRHPGGKKSAFFKIELDDSLVLAFLDQSSCVSNCVLKGPGADKEIEKLSNVFGMPVPVAASEIESLSKGLGSKVSASASRVSVGDKKQQKAFNLEKTAIFIFLFGLLAYGASTAADMREHSLKQDSQLQSSAFRLSLEQQYKLKAGSLVSQMSPKLSQRIREIVNGTQFLEITSYEFSAGQLKFIFDTQGVPFGKEAIEKYGQYDREGESIILIAGKPGV